MTLSLFLLPELEDVAVGSVVTLSGEEGRHAARVKRVDVGEGVLVGNGRGLVLSCSVVSVGFDVLSLNVLDVRRSTPPAVRLVVVQALPKGDRAELAVEIMTELGVDEIIPWSASRSIVQWHGIRGDKARAKWQSTAREASKQSRRAVIPEVAALASTAAVVTRLISASAGLVLHEDATVGIGAVELPINGDVVLVVGPEGGVSPEELEAFSQAGGQSVRLGPEVLRTSTAGAAALAALAVRLDRW